MIGLFFAYLVVSLIVLLTMISYDITIEEIENIYLRRLAIIVTAPADIILLAIVTFFEGGKVISEVLDEVDLVVEAWND